MEFKVSPSSISLMKDCSRCFWLDRHGVWKRPPGIFPSLPSGMDRILKKHFDFFRDKDKLPPELCENGFCEGMQLFGQDEGDKLLLEVWRNARKGLVYRNEEENILHGALDSVLVHNGKLIVLDYKTRGYALKENTASYYQSQLDIYTFLLKKNGYEVEDFGFLLFYIPNHVTESGDFVFDAELMKIPVNIKNAEDIFKKAIELLKGDCPKESCVWCEGVEVESK